MKPFPISVVAFGSGSQPEEDESLDYMRMPGGMDTYQLPLLPEPEALAARGEAKRVLRELSRALDRVVSERRNVVIDLSALDAANLAVLNQVLGEGEVSARVGWNDAPVMIQESVFAGVWRVVDLRPGAVLRDYLEVGAAPGALFEAARNEELPPLQVPAQLPSDVMNAPPILFELAQKIRIWYPGAPPHIVNLTLLPLTEADIEFMDDALGPGQVSVLSRGYGNCRIESTGARCCWRVVYFNSEDAMILNTLEVTDLPETAQAAPEDLADSRGRLAEVLDWVLQS